MLVSKLKVLALSKSNFSSFTFSAEKWYFVFKIVLTYCEKNSSID